MTPELLTQCGQSLYGAFWHSILAEYLHVNRRTVSRWAEGRNPVPETIKPELLGLIGARIDDLKFMYDQVAAKK